MVRWDYWGDTIESRKNNTYTYLTDRLNISPDSFRENNSFSRQVQIGYTQNKPVIAHRRDFSFSRSYSRIALGAALGILGLSIMAISAAGLAASFGASSFLSVAGILLGKHIVAYGIWLTAGAVVSGIGADMIYSQKKITANHLFLKKQSNSEPSDSSSDSSDDEIQAGCSNLEKGVVKDVRIG
ncbi:MAG: hypothetical protein A3E82_02585 [Gammaproteobacteria bacterium RIFCSPHIGHO2_12_FULL_38_11]|nr:MAG: hypothetical protein A3E82_02585 [Gammaproteobacteria bacterium RIFCSPHIGHO2_12_FULL_38_11]